MKTLNFFSAAVLFFASLTAAQAGTHSEAATPGNFTQEVIDQVNRVRTNPQAYAAYLENFRAYYTADGMFRAPGRRMLRTHEGVAALDQAIRTLQHASAQVPIAASDLLAGAGPRTHQRPTAERPDRPRRRALRADATLRRVAEHGR